ncbi:MAG: hypothetical protein WC314_04250 [Vulcanimicrobiota bacterium]
MRSLNHTKRGAAAAIIGVVLVILAVVAAYFFMQKKGPGKSGGSALELAAMMPADSQFAWGWDLNGQLDYVGWVKDFKEIQKDLPETAQTDLVGFEQELGMSLEAWLQMYDGRGFLAVVPDAANESGIMAAVGLQDGAKFDEWWTKQAESYGEPLQTHDLDGVTFVSVGENPPLIGHDPQWLYIADTQENAKKLLANVKGSGQTLDTLPAFKEGVERLENPSSGAFVFVPVNKLVEQVKASGAEGTDEKTFTDLAALEYVIASTDFAGAQVDGFTKVSGETEFAKQLLIPGTLSSTSLQAISGDATNLNSFDLKWSINTVLKLAQLSPEMRGQAGLVGMGLMSQGDPWAAFRGDLTVAGNAPETLVSSLSTNFSKARDQGQLTACKSNLKNIGVAMEMYATDWSGRYPSTTALLTPNYLKTIPECPTAGRDIYSASLQTGPEASGNEEGFPDYYYFCCQGKNHPETAENYPSYNSITGLEDGGATFAEEESVVEEKTPSTVVVASLTDADTGHAFINKLLQIGGEPPKKGEEQSYSPPSLMFLPGLTFKLSNQETPMAIASYGPEGSKLLDTASGSLAQREVVKELMSWGKDGIVYFDYTNLEPAYQELLKILKESDDPEARAGLAVLEKLRAQIPDLEGASCLVVQPQGLRYRARGISNAGLVGVAAAIMVPNFVRARGQGQLTACKSNQKNIGTALEMYSTDYSGRYPQDISKITPNYLKTMPQCPAAGRDTYSESYRTEQPDGSQWEVYYFHCSGANHADLGLPPNFPAYNGLEGLIERP